jgi:hypothetical protein
MALLGMEFALSHKTRLYPGGLWYDEKRFYDKFSNAGGWRYLEAAPKETELSFAFGDAWLGGSGNIPSR